MNWWQLTFKANCFLLSNQMLLYYNRVKTVQFKQYLQLQSGAKWSGDIKSLAQKSLKSCHKESEENYSSTFLTCIFQTRVEI